MLWTEAFVMEWNLRKLSTMQELREITLATIAETLSSAPAADLDDDEEWVGALDIWLPRLGSNNKNTKNGLF